MTTVPQHPQPPDPPATAPWVVATLSGLAAVVGVVVCGGAAFLVWLRPGATEPLAAALSTGAFLVGTAAFVVSVVTAARR